MLRTWLARKVPRIEEEGDIQNNVPPIAARYRPEHVLNAQRPSEEASKGRVDDRGS